MPAFRNWIHIAATLAIIVAGGAARAEEPFLELIRGLRAQGEPDLALEYIQERLAGKIPPELNQVLALETARTRVEIARQESEESKRLALFAAARIEFENFLKANPNHPLAPQARFEIARLIASQGKEAVNRARRAQGEVRQKALKDARPSFETAGTQLIDAAKLLKTQIDAIGEPTTPEDKVILREAVQSWLKAQFEAGMNLYWMAQTYVTDERAEDIKQHGKLMGDAGAAFEKLMKLDPKQPLCWLARAWVARCYFENDDYPKAVVQLDAIQKERGPQADEARRVADYFRILLQRKQGSASLTQQLTMLQQWADRYHTFLNTPEGCGVRYVMADVLENQAYAIPNGIKRNEKGRPISVSGEAANKLKLAERQLRALTEFENDFSDRATNKRMGIILAIAIRETPDRDPAKLSTFENCYLLALLEVAELNEAVKDPKIGDNPEEVAKLRKSQYTRVIKALERGLSLLKPTDPPKEVLDARITLAYAFITVGRNREAADLGEQLAKSLTRTSKGAAPALIALQAYRSLMIEAKARDDVKEEELRNIREQVRRLAAFMETNWPNDSPTDTARHNLGTLYFSEGDYVKALETYARVTPMYQSLAFLRNEQGIACFDLQKDPKVPPAVKQFWFQNITTELEKMPDLAQGAEPETAYAYCLAKMQLGNLLLQAGKDFPRVETIGKTIYEQSGKYDLGEKAAEIKYTAKAQMLYGLYGRILELMKAQRHVEAAQLYQPFIAELQKNGIPDDEAAAKTRKAILDLLQLSLRSSVQDGQIDRAQGMLKLLEKASASQKDMDPGSGPLVVVLREVQAQISDMRKNDPARLKDAIDKFATFLDTLAKQPNLSAEVKLFLAQGFASLDNPNRGLDLLNSIQPPAEKDPGPSPTAVPETASDAERVKFDAAKTKYDAARQAYDHAWGIYHFAQLTRVRELRQAGRQDANADAKKKALQEAEKILQEIIGTPQKQGWGFNSLEVRREQGFWLEDQGRFQDALQFWNMNQRPFLLRMQERMGELEALKRATPETIEKEADAAESRLNQSDKEFLASPDSKRLQQRIAKLHYDAALQEIEKLKPPAAVHQILQRRLLASKLRNQQALEEELMPVQASESGQWLQANVIAKRLHLDEGMREIAKKLRASRGLNENQRLDPSAEKALLETMLLLAALREKPNLDVEFQRFRGIVYGFHFYKIRCVYESKARSPTLMKDEKKREAEYRKVVANILKVEKDEQTADFGGNDVKKLYRELLDDDELLKKAYIAEGGAALVSP